ncbi:MAG: hypothetical protein JW814_11775 [Candidatus Krumholzibacteriota bacterium]|nr:hypothetical protein [Candidatus Krumholzibacteriota bacterium]
MISKVEEMSNTKNDIRGCIDIGSSYFRLLVARGSFSCVAERAVAAKPATGNFPEYPDLMTQRTPEIFPLHESRLYVGWGADLEETGVIGPEMIEEAEKALARLVGEAARAGCAEPVIVATNTLRRAANRKYIASRFEKIAGRPVSVLTHRGEAEFAIAGAASLLEKNKDIILFDPGGTSTEAAWTDAGKISGFSRFLTGTHSVDRLIRRHHRGGYRQNWLKCVVRKTVRDLMPFIGSALGDSGGVIKGVSLLSERVESSTILFTGGTAVSQAVFFRYMNRTPVSFSELTGMTRDDLRLISMRLMGILGRGSVKSLPLEMERIKLMIPGLILIEAITGSLGIERYFVVTRDLRWGVILSGGIMPGGYRTDE